MSGLINANNNPMMGSRKIAAVTDKEPKHVVRDIKAMLEQLGIYSPNMDCSDFKGFLIAYKEHGGRTVIDEIWLNETLSMTLVTGYDANRRLALVEQWQEMKTELAQPRLESPQPQQTVVSMNDNILSLARVVAEATASATMKAVIDIVGIQKYQPVVEPVVAIAPPAPEALQVSHHTPDSGQSEYALVSDLSWACGLSDAACRRLATFANLPTCMTSGDRGHLLIHRDSFMSAAQTLLDESTPPTGKLKRWQHPEFGGFTLRLKSGNNDGEKAQ
ncbi:Rha family transcriptional regulator [Yersinia enterocolitica]|uniref:Rha family transcriptional regulator n=1 Tax=Yersinia enterocolitica TaxID=630 RepID=UPI0038B81699